MLLRENARLILKNLATLRRKKLLYLRKPVKQTTIGKAAMYHDHLGEGGQWREQENPEK